MRILSSISTLTLIAVASPALAATLYVDAGAPPGGDGLSWATAYDNLNEALDSAVNGDEIRISQGVYKPDIGPGRTPGDRNAHFYITAGITVRGGFAGISEIDPDVRNFQLFETMLSGDLSGNDQPAFVNYEDNSRNVVQHGPGEPLVSFALEGVTITGGNADDDTGPFPAGHGGGLCLLGCAALQHCRFIANSARIAGGGAFVASTMPATLDHCTFLDNRVTDSAGESDGGGGALLANLTQLHIFNCLFARNTSDSHGGAFHNFHMLSFMVNCVIADNHAGLLGGGVAGSGPGGSLDFYNCILWGNDADDGNTLDDQVTILFGAVFDHNIIEGWTTTPPGAFAVSVSGSDPLFANAAGGDYHIGPASPCVEAGTRGDNTPAEAILGDTDVDGEPRIAGCEIDIGIDELPFGATASGDLNGDGIVNAADVQPLVAAILGPPGAIEICVGDLNDDEALDDSDIALFVARLTN